MTRHRRRPRRAAWLVVPPTPSHNHERVSFISVTPFNAFFYACRKLKKIKSACSNSSSLQDFPRFQNISGYHFSSKWSVLSGKHFRLYRPIVYSMLCFFLATNTIASGFWYNLTSYNIFSFLQQSLIFTFTFVYTQSFNITWCNV